MKKPSKQHGESVLFALHRQGQILCEWRNWSGAMMHSIPGGKVEPADKEIDDYQSAALVREMDEEFGVTPARYRFLGDIWYGDEWVFHVYLVEEWDGDLPANSFEGNKPLNWILPSDLQDNQYMPGIADLIRTSVT